MMTKTASILEQMGHEMKVNPPAILGHTERKFGPAKAEAQRKAILLSKAREAGAHIPGMKYKMNRMHERFASA